MWCGWCDVVGLMWLVWLVRCGWCGVMWCDEKGNDDDVLMVME